LYDSPTKLAAIAVTARLMMTQIGCLSRFTAECSGRYAATVALAVSLHAPIAPRRVTQRAM
jgi:hypothetical protein